MDSVTTAKGIGVSFNRKKLTDGKILQTSKQKTGIFHIKTIN